MSDDRVGPDETQKQIAEAARTGDVALLDRILAERPELLELTTEPFGATLLHLAAAHPAAVELLLRRGLDPNARESGDNTYAMHWAAAAGALESVRLLADAGGDVVGAGDDHWLEVIGWAACWDGCDDARHRAVADLLVARGARHHIFSAVALELDDEVRSIVASDPRSLNQRMSRSELYQQPLHFAVRMHKPRMVALLIQLGADPLGADGAGMIAPAYATDMGSDVAVLEKIRSLTLAEMESARAGDRTPNVLPYDLLATAGVGDWESARELWGAARPEARAGLLHTLAKRGDENGVRWALDMGADPNAMHPHWDADVTPLHLATFAGHKLLPHCCSIEGRVNRCATRATTEARWSGQSTSTAGNWSRSSGSAAGPDPAARPSPRSDGPCSPDR
jgi:ankyrin repeat protein